MKDIDLTISLIKSHASKYVQPAFIPAYGEMYLHNNTISQSIPIGNIYTKITPPMVKGESLNCEVDEVNQRIIIAIDGKYRVSSSFSSKANSNNVILETALLLNGQEVTKDHTIRRISINEPSTGAMSCILDLKAGDIIEVSVEHNSASSINLLVQHGNLNLIRIS